MPRVPVTRTKHGWPVIWAALPLRGSGCIEGITCSIHQQVDGTSAARPDKGNGRASVAK
ncbi:hypothetical protein VCH24_27050 [Variovorax boronicumulans]|nr:hypothetical protein VCH24_27050 [Variovorax boronicumulans]